jgi:hypothetical protein
MKGEIAAPAWKSKPSWFAISAQDRTITPELEATLAKKINATTITLPTCHVAILA